MKLLAPRPLLAVLAVLAVGSVTLPASAAHSNRFAVTALAPISGPVSLPTGCAASQDDNTAQLAVDPRNPKRLVASYSMGAGAVMVVATSLDGGVTWSRTATEDLSGCGAQDRGQGLDPDLAVGAGGTTWATQGVLDTPPTSTEQDAVREYAAAAAPGQSLRSAVDVGPTEPLQRGWLSTDPSHDGTAYVLTERADYATTYLPGLPVAGVSLRASTDGGRSWQLRGTVATNAPGHALLAAGLERSGDVLVAFVHDVFLPTAAPGLLPGGSGVTGTAVAYRSTDNGATWVRAGDIGIQPACCLLDTAAAPHGTLYVTWTQPATDGGTDVFVACSRDGGMTWHGAVAEHRASGAAESAVAVDPAGAVGLFWYSGGDDPNRPTDLSPRLATSTDHGATWSSSLLLAAPFDPSSITTTNDTGPLGPYQDLVGLPHGFGVAFTAGGSNVVAGGTADVLFARVRDGS